MRDLDLRLALGKVLGDRHRDDPATLIRHEVGICAGRRRVDIAVINGELAGFELKSDEDTLLRLAGQAESYSRVFDRVTIVTAARHLDHAMDVIPTWWGVMVASQSDAAIKIDEVRESGLNTSHDAFAVAQLLWRDEALEELRKRGESRGLSGKARYYVWKALAELVAVDELRQIVREYLKARPDWPGGRRHVPDDATDRTSTTP